MLNKTDKELRINGKFLYLRPINTEDIKGHYPSWMNDPQVTKFLESRFLDNSIENIRTFVENISKNPDILFLAIVVKEGNQHIGNIKLGPVNRHHRSAELGILIGEKNQWGKGYATEAIGILVRYAFEELKLHKITAGCYANNLGSMAAFKKVGFKEEGRRQSQFRFNGEYVDSVLLGIINPIS
ncbi:GNAT family N-acetyltransferase [Candidatus Micrarchaeota archaeon]|nr:GNAT family N-acetyltransferase [Candidatus Micrarchaeota archaeon]